MFARVEDGKGICELCPRGCVLREGANGVCRTRKMQEGKVIAVNYGAVASASIDPIEKKPLYHFMPGTGILSIGTFGCNLSCKFCQNWELSMGEPRVVWLSPEELAQTAKTRRRESVGVAYTYSEPLVWYEFVYDCAKLVHEAGLANVLVTNGQINQRPLEELLPHIDAMNIDLKGANEEFYRKTCSGRLLPVLQTIESAFRAGCHVEITTLVIPGLNDSEDDMRTIAGWMSDLSPDIPLHLSRYFPNHEMDIPPTSIDTLQSCRRIARERLNYVYIGNAQVPGGSDTTCPSCGETLISRDGFGHVDVRLNSETCPACGRRIPVRLGPVSRG